MAYIKATTNEQRAYIERLLLGNDDIKWVGGVCYDFVDFEGVISYDLMAEIVDYLRGSDIGENDSFFRLAVLRARY